MNTYTTTLIPPIEDGFCLLKPIYPLIRHFPVPIFQMDWFQWIPNQLASTLDQRSFPLNRPSPEINRTCFDQSGDEDELEHQ